MSAPAKKPLMAIYTCPKCGLSDANVAGSAIHCAGISAWGTSHRRVRMDQVEVLPPAGRMK